MGVDLHHQSLSVFILLRSLGVGGAERQVSVLAKALCERGHKVTLCLFYGGGEWEEKLQDAGVSICHLHKKGRWDIGGWFRRYLKAIRDTNPDVIYSFLPTANIVAIIGKFFFRKPIVWGIRASNMELQNYDWLASLTIWIERNFSRFADKIIFNSYYGLRYHESLNYCVDHSVVIPNGIDTTAFKSLSAEEKMKIRNQLGIPQNAFVIGMLARVDPIKDYETYRAAARALCPKHKDLYFIAAGEGTDTAIWGTLPPRFLRLGVWQEIPTLLNALNVMVLCSLGEGFPNVVAEAMACGIPTIVTDVGDAAAIVGDLGMVIPPKDPETLIQAIEAIIPSSFNPEELRNRIVSDFNIPQMADRTFQVLASVRQHP